MSCYNEISYEVNFNNYLKLCHNLQIRYWSKLYKHIYKNMQIVSGKMYLLFQLIVHENKSQFIQSIWLNLT